MKRQLINAGWALAAAVVLWGCNVTSSGNVNVRDDDGDHDPYDPPPETTLPIMVTYKSLFPYENSKNWWRYSDGDGNLFSIDVADTISDEADLYYKVAFTEDKLNETQDNWFRKADATVRYSAHLTGPYTDFLPSEFEREGGGFYSGGYRVAYSVLDTLEAGGRTYRNVIELRYGSEILHGFDRIYFAEDVGIVRMVDEDGRWPIDYTLDSARVAGKRVYF